MNAILGKGSFGTVFLGKNTTNDELVAVKVIDKKMANYVHELFIFIYYISHLVSQFIIITLK